MDFNIARDSSPKQTSDAINYLLANVGGITTNPLTGAIIGGNKTIAYLYKYIHIKYATNTNGTGFSNVPTNATYYGIFNSDSSTESTNPSDYLWIANSFGTTNSLFYKCTGGRSIVFQIAATTSQPTDGFIIDRGNAVDLDLITSLNVFIDTNVGFAGYSGAATTTFGEEITYGPFDLASGRVLVNTNGYLTVTSNFGANRRLKVEQRITATNAATGYVTFRSVFSTYSFFSGGPYNQIVPFSESTFFNAFRRTPLTIKIGYTIDVIDGNTNGVGPYNEMTVIVPFVQASAIELNI